MKFEIIHDKVYLKNNKDYYYLIMEKRINANGNVIEFFNKSLFHNANGAARIVFDKDGLILYSQYYLYGVRYPKKEFYKIIKK